MKMVLPKLTEQMPQVLRRKLRSRTKPPQPSRNLLMVRAARSSVPKAR
jgi:hypothetical protein